jgi:hypothetical protein
VFHVSLLEPYREDGRVQPPPPPIEMEGALEYEVESILEHRFRGTRRCIVLDCGRNSKSKLGPHTCRVTKEIAMRKSFIAASHMTNPVRLFHWPHIH